MGKLYITEYRYLVTDLNGRTIPAGEEPGVTTQTVTFSTSAQSSAFNPETKFVRVHTDSICSVKFGTNPTATTNDARLVAGQTEFFGVPQAGNYKIAAVDNT